MLIAIIIMTIVVTVLIAVATVNFSEQRRQKRIEAQRKETILKILESTTSLYDEISKISKD